MGTPAFSTDQRRHHRISGTERIGATGSLVLIERSFRISDLSTSGKSFGILPHKSPLPTAAARRKIISVIALAVIATAGVLELFHWRRGLVLGFGLVALGCFAVRILFGSSRRMRVPKQLIGALGLSSTAAGAYYAATGRINATSILLWLASWLFAVGQIEYVHLRISAAQVEPHRQKLHSSMAVCFLHLLMIGASITAAFAGFAPFLLTLAFVPSLIRLSVWLARPWRPLGVHILGVSELLQGLLFNILMISAFLFHT